MTGREPLADSHLELVAELLCKFNARPHDEKEEDLLVEILRSPATHTEAVAEVVHERCRLNNGIYLTTAKSNARRVYAFVNQESIGVFALVRYLLSTPSLLPCIT